MSAIKKFFQKKKQDLKFKTAGAGHRLDEERVAPRSSAPRQKTERVPPSESTIRAAEAAMARLQGPAKKQGGASAAIKAEVRRELELEREKKGKALAQSDGPKEFEHAPIVSGVFFKCPMVGPEVLPKKEMEARIHEFLLSQLAEEPEMASSLIIHTVNKDKEKINTAIDILKKYLDNLIKAPSEEKFRKIRLANKIYSEKLSNVEGVDEFLQSVGFERQKLPNPEIEEEFYVISEEKASNAERLESIKETLMAAEPIKPELDHGLKVLAATGNVYVSQADLPDEFFAISKEEIKKEQQRREEAIEKMGLLRTKEMKERDRQRDLRKYRYTLIRVRFPYSVVLQGTFRSGDKLSAVFEFVRENLECDWVPFTLSSSTGQKLTEEDSTLAELNLAPASLLNFAFDPTILEEMKAEQGDVKYLSTEVLALLESM